MRPVLVKIPSRKILSGLWLVVLFSGVAVGAPREHGAHVHGEAILDIALEGHRLDLHLDAPGVSLIGFEHPPVDAPEKALYASAVGILRNPSHWLAPTAAAACLAKPVVVEAHGFDPLPASRPQTEVDVRENPAHEHADFDVDVSFTCMYPDKLMAINVALFARFPSLHKVIVNLALPTGQGRQELQPSATTVRLGK